MFESYLSELGKMPRLDQSDIHTLNAGHEREQRLTTQMLRDADAEIERLRNLVQDMIDNDPNDPNEAISDAGHTVLDLLWHNAREALGQMSDKPE